MLYTRRFIGDTVFNCGIDSLLVNSNLNAVQQELPQYSSQMYSLFAFKEKLLGLGHPIFEKETPSELAVA